MLSFFFEKKKNVNLKTMKKGIKMNKNFGIIVYENSNERVLNGLKCIPALRYNVLSLFNFLKITLLLY